MQDLSGVSGAAPAWLEIMTHLHPADALSLRTALAVPTGVTQRMTLFDPPLEPPRSEWFVAGTEMDVVALQDPSSRPPRILYPGDGTILAMDPDIPEEQQRLFFRMSAVDANLHWRLDDQPVDPGEGWSLSRGEHRLTLTDAQAQVVDEVRFFVR